jgi:hypothetical protein
VTFFNGKIYFFIFVLCILTGIQTVRGQADSVKALSDTAKLTVDSTSVYYFTGTLDSLKEGYLHYADTSLTLFHQYDPAEAGNQMRNTLNTIGLASESRVFSPSTGVGYQMKTPAFAPYLVYNDEVNYFKTMRPYTQLRYVMGPAKEQSLWVTFSRKFSKQFTFGLKFYLVNAPGRYQNSKADDKYVYFTLRYHTKDRRWNILANYLHNKVSVQENGGITADSLFVMNIEKDRKAIPVALQTAHNLIKTSGFYFEQNYNLMKPGLKADSLPRKLAGGSVSYSILYQQNKLIYTDQGISDSGFYQLFPVVFDTLRTYDSAYQQRFRNRLMWSSLSYDQDRLSHVFVASFGVMYDHIRQVLPYDSTPFINNQIIPFGNISLKLFQRSFLHATAEMVLGGYNNGDMKISGHLLQYLGSVKKNVGQLYVKVLFENRTPAWYFSHYRSNRFNWKNSLRKERIFTLTGEYRYHSLRAGVTLQTLGNYTFFNDSVFPQQSSSPGSVMQLYTSGTIPLHHFGINLRAVYQTTTMGKLLHLPQFTGKLNLYYRNWLFNRAAHLQTGLQLSYFTAYYADAYMPELRAFYLQHKQKIGDYPSVDMYATLRIKTFRFFLQAKNVLSFISKEKHYYNAPGYPGYDGGFFLGISWKLYN